MANNLSDFLENKVLDHVLGTTAYTMPTSIYVALFTTDPTDADTGTEVATTDGATLADATTAPTLTQVANANSTLTAATYYVQYTWKNDAGETLGSTEANLATTAGYELHISVPAFPTGVTSAGVYVGTSTGTGKYQGDITTSGSDYVLTANPTTTGSALPTTNTTNSTAYERTTVAFTASSGGSTSNSADVLFPVATGTWGTITHIGIYDSTASDGTENLLWHGALTTSKSINKDDQFKISTGNLSVSID